MKTTELRIGNIVQDYLSLIRITSLKKEMDDKSISPVRLTEEWLIKLGFKGMSKYSYWNFVNSNFFVISMWMEDKQSAGFEEKGVCYYGSDYIPIKYVHQLQNLYFALTQKELSLKDENTL